MSTTDILKAAGDGPLSRTLHSEAIASTIIAGLPAWLDPYQFRRTCVAAFADDAFAGIHPREQLRAVLKCAELGVLPGAHGHIAFIPRGGKLHAEIMFRGYVYLAEQQEHIRKVTPHVVHTSDPFTATEIAPNQWRVDSHGRQGDDPFGSRSFAYKKNIKLDATGLRGVYLQIDHVDGSTVYHVIPGDRILRNMAASRTDSISSRYPERFFRKTGIRAAWADGVFSGGNDEITARGLAMREMDIGADTSRPAAVRAPSMLDHAVEVPPHDEDTGEVIEVEAETVIVEIDDGPELDENGDIIGGPST